jgi:hypothetical protein
MFGDGTRCTLPKYPGCRRLCWIHCPSDPHTYRGPIGPYPHEDDQIELPLNVLWRIAKRLVHLGPWLAGLLREIGDNGGLIGRLEAEASEFSASLDGAEHFDEADQARFLVQVVTEFDPLLDQAIRAIEEAGAAERLREFAMPEYASTT